MFEQFKNILIQEFSVEADLITPEAELSRDLGINSLELADLVLLCEDKMDVEINDDQLSKFITVKDVVDYLQSIA